MYLYVPPVEYNFTLFSTSSSTIGAIPSFEKTEIKADLILTLFIISKIIKLEYELSLFLTKEFNFVNTDI